MILVNRVVGVDRFRVGVEFFSNESSSTYFLLGWFAGYGRNGCIFSGEYMNAAQMSEKYALEMVEYLKCVHENRLSFRIHGKRYGVLSSRTCTCDILPSGVLDNIREF